MPRAKTNTRTQARATGTQAHIPTQAQLVKQQKYIGQAINALNQAQQFSQSWGQGGTTGRAMGGRGTQET
jgi:hypothetical protein